MTEPVKYDGILDIAIGKTRLQATWKNKQMQWSDLVKKLSETHTTAETYSEYIAFDRKRQDEIKDVGGFVGGYLQGGKRKVHTVMHRQLLTLDMDYGSMDAWENFTLLYNCAAVFYTTHKHSPKSPRFRVVIPLSREVSIDEFKAISRRIADNIGIDLFDHTTSFKPSQIMYWPSTAKDGEFLFYSQDGPWLDVDETLATYTDWTDTSSWPTGTKENALIDREIKKQGDPLEKKGIIGAFCRTYTISEAIEKYLSDVYEPCDVEGRYSYKEGSTSAGLVVYDDKFVFSHHGTDPISGNLCNAFDLVRIHKFGLKDEGSPVNVKSINLPSYKAMQELASNDKEVNYTRAKELTADIDEAFSGVEIEDTKANDEWKKLLKADRQGKFLSTIDNIYIILKHDPRLKNALVYDEFEQRLIAIKNLPWRKVSDTTKDFSDDDSDCLAHYLEGNNMPFTHIQKALAKIRTEHKIHPVREYLQSLKWDGAKRLETLFIYYLGADNSDYIKAITRKTLVAAVARVMQPGVKFDTVLTLVGKEGIGKSTIIAKLAKQWFSDCLGDIHAKDGMESLRGVWIMEIAELASFRRADQDAIKRFISSPADDYRPAYGRQKVSYPRQSIFIATTNRDTFLTGAYGNRRFLPIATLVNSPTKDVFKEFTESEINQVWAEAFYYYTKGESLDLSAEIKLVAEQIREQHSEVDERQGMIETYLETLLPTAWEDKNIYERRSFLAGGEDDISEKGTVQRTAVCVAEIWCEVLNGMQKDMTTNNTKFIHEILKKMKNWKQDGTVKRFNIYGRQRPYYRVNTRGFRVDNRVDKKEWGVNTDNTNVNTNLN
jgi:putative DNA primase/helicase